MQKKIYTTLLLTGIILGTSQTTFAAEEIKKGYQTIDNVDGNQYDSEKGIEIPVNGTLGNLDNTDPNENITEGDERWLNVTLPTSIVFNTDEAHKNILAPQYKVINNSARAVNLTLSKFEGKMEKEALTSLNLKGLGEPIEVVKNGIGRGSFVDANNPNGLLLGKIETKGQEKSYYDFTFQGTVDSEKLDKNEESKVSYTMDLKFEVLDEDGESVGK